MTVDNAEPTRLREAARVADCLTRRLDEAGRAMRALLDDGDGAPLQLCRNDPDGPTAAEAAAHVAADALDRTARRLLELHRLSDGPGVADFGSACGRYAEALHVAAAGRWPDDLDAIYGALHAALQEAAADARLTAAGTLRGHDLDQSDRRAAGLAGERLAARVDFECRHALAKLRRLASVAAP